MRETDSDFQALATRLLDSAKLIFKYVLICAVRGTEENSQRRQIADSGWIATFLMSAGKLLAVRSLVF